MFDQDEMLVDELIEELSDVVKQKEKELSRKIRELFIDNR